LFNKITLTKHLFFVGWNKGGIVEASRRGLWYILGFEIYTE
jgi:hypothetical protein